MNRFFTSWSGGKDSCFALMKAYEQGHSPMVLLNMMNENNMISRSHAIPKAILENQASMIDLPIVTKPASWESYEVVFIETLKELKSDYLITAGVFGDIDLQAHRDWEEKVCRAAGIEAILPLWKQDRKELVYHMLDAGIETYIVSCNETMGEKFLGRRIDEDLIDELEKIEVDVCGENGEYHTLVVNAPLFKKRIDVNFGAASHIGNYWFIEMTLV
ncbi:MAG TPA: diphthine--ammonia ligase [Chryseolinea sp.]|nr:diphthine--ammonia ligase [Chryseolinea sp.]HPH47581.1 diphthine--ammonia ligase [Chryseolinea sp.]HPM31359.1 diphthine--ammonia ligase [Chryseolinea sp.]